MNTKEKYLSKLENDVSERIFDIMMIHLLKIHDKIPKHKEDGYYLELIKILEGALKILGKGINSYTKLSYYRYSLLICNIILSYDTSREDIKDVKKKIIEDYTHSDNLTGKIPLDYQINEIRITYDTKYLNYLIKKLIEKDKEWNKALYCLIATRWIEPDDEKLDKYYSIIKENIKDKEIIDKKFLNAENKLILLDSNIVISQIIYDTEEYKYLGNYDHHYLDSYAKNNQLVITTSVLDEVNEHIDFKLSHIRRVCSKTNQDFNKIKEVIEQRTKDFYDKCKILNVKIEDIDDIKEFYSNYLNKLEEILEAKIRGKIVSHKLRKLAHRTCLLPEEGDMNLLKEAITLKQTGKNVGILTQDKDFTIFAGCIYEEFGVEVYEG